VEVLSQTGCSEMSEIEDMLRIAVEEEVFRRIAVEVVFVNACNALKRNSYRLHMVQNIGNGV
jgi:hypothetical protein